MATRKRVLSLLLLFCLLPIPRLLHLLFLPVGRNLLPVLTLCRRTFHLRQ